ncbi:VOC family protein [Roseomonas eburnea]|uniref:VOC family protein n=1 Tax=Neoroseomonas eburnea TaxID=1346889 RepID=A0A9X9X640_9PROT|nr:VOC family protein [Neoroseomonas eburnea]MBR0679176.1 VOC family protein [Neoroseomonas eburnea]
MAAFTFDHIHLRSPDPEATAAFYARVFGAELKHGPQRIDINLGGQAIFVSPINETTTGDAPSAPYRGLEHIGLAVTDIDAVVAEMKTKGVTFTMEPTTIRPGVRIAFLRGPENVSIELLERSAA